MSKTKFCMQLAKLKVGVRYCGLSFHVHDQTEGFINPVIREACGDSMDYGKLFAYLFRRFGYPSGMLGNAAPKEFAALHGLILKLGKGNAARGIKKATALLDKKPA